MSRSLHPLLYSSNRDRQTEASINEYLKPRSLFVDIQVRDIKLKLP